MKTGKDGDVLKKLLIPNLGKAFWCIKGLLSPLWKNMHILSGWWRKGVFRFFFFFHIYRGLVFCLMMCQINLSGECMVGLSVVFYIYTLRKVNIFFRELV